MDGQRRERLAAVVAVPDDHLVGATRQKAFDRRIDLAGRPLTHLGVFRVGLVLTARHRRRLPHG